MAARPQRPATRRNFEIAVICALTLEADAVEALFDHHWDDDGPPYDKLPGDPNAYSTGAMGRHNVVLAYMPGMGKANAAAVAANCRLSFPSIKLAVVVGVCGVVPYRRSGEEVVLGDIVISDGVVQYDLGRQLPDRFMRKDTLLDTLGRPNAEIRALLAKLQSLRGRKMLRSKMVSYLEVLRVEVDLAAEYPGVAQDRLFKATYRHIGKGSCDECGCNGPLVLRDRLEQDYTQPAIHFGPIASGDTVMKSGEDRDAIAQQEGVIGFEMEGAGVWDSFPCVVIKAACDYADSHKTKVWQRYAAATAASCMKAFLDHWVPSVASGYVPEPPAGPWFLVPYPRNEDFVGRAAILEKLQQLPLRSASQARVSLFGLGGIGKTQIALEYIYRLQKTYLDVSVFWVHASNAQRFRQAYTSIAQECNIPGYDDPKVDILSLVKGWLERKNHGLWLMVIDNADDTQLFFGQPDKLESSSVLSDEGNIGRYIPECAHGSILVTTRNKQAGSRLAKGKLPIEVGKMDEDESSQLLRAKLEGNPVSGELSALSSRLEHIPLALVQAAAYIHENTISVGEYLQLLDGSDQDLVDLLSEEFETVGRDSETPRAVAETWILSFDKIQRQNAFSGELLSLVSCFDRQAIPATFLAYYSKQQRNQEVGREIQLQKALGVLKAFSFISEGKDRSIDIHRLVQLVTRNWLIRKEAISYFASQALFAVSDAYPFGSYEKRAVCQEYLPHVYAVLEIDSTGSGKEAVAKATLLHNTAGYFLYRGQWKNAERLQLEAIKLQRETFWEEHPDTLTSVANLASTYRNQGRWKEAEDLEVQVMETRKRVLGEEHPDTLTSVANLALTYQNQGRWKEAEDLEVQVIETSKRVLGEEHPDTLTSVASLASTYRNQGRWKEAEDLEVQVMETRKRVLGEEHPHTLSSMNNLASTYWNQGRWKEAEDLEVQVMETRKRVLGEEHPDTLTSVANLALTYQNQGRWKEAEDLGVQVMETRKRVLGEEHPHTLTSVANLASTYQNQGRWKEAEDLEVQVMETSKRVLGEEHPHTLTSVANLASTYWNQGRWKEAEDLEVQVMETRKRVLGEEHPDTLTSMNNLAHTWHGQGRCGDALELMLRCFRLQLQAYGLDHPYTMSSLSAVMKWQASESPDDNTSDLEAAGASGYSDS